MTKKISILFCRRPGPLTVYLFIPYSNPNREYLGIGATSFVNPPEILFALLTKIHTLLVLPGKSTLALLLTDDQSLRAVEESDEFTVIHDTPVRSVIGTTTTVSHTTFPEPFFDKVKDVVYYDCPGFGDSRQAKPHIEIANAIFLKRVAEHAETLKVLVVVNHFSVRRGADRIDFLETLTHLNNLFNVTSFSGGIGLVVTKVEHHASDEKVVSNIARFLKEVQENLQITSSQDELEPRKLLIEEFLQKGDNGTYDRISIFRRPTTPGLLSTNQPIQKNKKAIQEMVDALAAIRHSNDDVGYVLSTKARLLIKKVHEQLEDQTMEEIRSWSESMEKALVGMLDQNSTLHEAWSASQLEANFELSRLPLMQEMLSLQHITDYMSRFQPSIDHEAEDVVSNNARAMEFLQKVDARINAGSWTEAHQVLQRTSEKIEKSLKNSFGSVLDNLVTHLRKQYPKSFPSTEVSSTEQLTTYVQRHLGCIANHQQGNVKKWQVNSTTDKTETVNNTESLLSCFEVIKSDDKIKEVEWLKEKSILITQFPVERYELFNRRLWLPMEVFFRSFLLMINRFSVKFDEVKEELVVHGDVLSIKKVVNSPDLAVYRGKMKKLSIIARHTIFLDTEVNGTDLNQGESLDLTIISPIWWASPGHKINLDGKPGARYPNTTRLFGAHGRPGVRGGNAGNFHGLGLDFRGTKLNVSAKGGNGGPGEDGADGEPGKQGISVETPSCNPTLDSHVTIVGGKYGYVCRSPSSNVIQHTCKPGDIAAFNGGPGSPGSEGGHGGQGGYGGQGGRVSVWRQGEGQYVSGSCDGGQWMVHEVFETGAKGLDGQGGIGGQGGLEGVETNFEVKTAQLGLRRTKRFWPLLFMAAWGATAGSIATNFISENKRSGSPTTYQPVVHHVQVVCSLERLGVQNHTTLSSRASPGKNGTAGVFKHDHLSTISGQQPPTKDLDLNCSIIQPDMLELLTDPDAAFESFDQSLISSSTVESFQKQIELETTTTHTSTTEEVRNP